MGAARAERFDAPPAEPVMTFAAFERSMLTTLAASLGVPPHLVRRDRPHEASRERIVRLIQDIRADLRAEREALMTEAAP